jgi:hypothetical protein
MQALVTSIRWLRYCDGPMDTFRNETNAGAKTAPILDLQRASAATALIPHLIYAEGVATSRWGVRLMIKHEQGVSLVFMTRPKGERADGTRRGIAAGGGREGARHEWTDMRCSG